MRATYCEKRATYCRKSPVFSVFENGDVRFCAGEFRSQEAGELELSAVSSQLSASPKSRNSRSQKKDKGQEFFDMTNRIYRIDFGEK